MKPVTAARLSALIGFLGVGLGAFGAHALQPLLVRNDAVATWQTAVFYHLVHAVMLCLLSTPGRFRPGPWWCFLCGVLVFSGSLYLLAATQIRWLGAITPLGGVSFLVGWVWLMLPGRPDRCSANL